MAEKRNLKDFIKKPFARFSGRGGRSAAICAAAILAAVLLNIAAAALPTNIMKFDMTDTGMYSLSDQSKQLAREIDEPVTIYALQSGQGDGAAYELALQYAAVNPDIRVETRDPAANPAFVRQYTDDDIGYGMIVESEKRSAVISEYDLYRTEIGANGQYQYYFDGELLLTGALDKVTTDSLPKIYILVGHGETDLPETLKLSLERDNFELDELTLLTQDSVPDDAACVLIHNPSADLSADDAAKLTSYLEGGGALMLMTEYPAQRLENLCSLAKNYGLEPVDGLVLERNANYFISGYPLFLLPQLGEHEITEQLTGAQTFVLIPGAQALAVADGARDTLEITSLMHTSADALSKLKGRDIDTSEKEEGDIDGPFDLGFAVAETTENGQSRFIWIGNSTMTESSADSIVSGANTGFLLNCFGWLSGKESSVTIRSDAITSDYLTLSAGSAAAWSGVMILVLPLAVLAAGIVVYVVRRRRT